MFPLTAAQSPRTSSKMRAVANELARSGEIAIVGRIAPWSELSPSHRERFDPGALRSERADMPPALLAQHTSEARTTADGRRVIPTIVALAAASHSIIEGRSADQYGPGGGFDVVWQVRRDPASVAALFDALADGVSGLSVEMKVRKESTVWESWTVGNVRHIHDAVTWAAAMVPSPSYTTARMDAVVTPEVVWTYDPKRQVLLPDVERHIMGAVYNVDRSTALQRAETNPDPITMATVAADPAMTAARASAFARLPGATEYRSPQDDHHGRRSR